MKFTLLQNKAFNLAGSQAIHERAPFIKSMLIAGPRGVGKKTLVSCICTETGANFFDLTASNIVGKYPGKSGLNMMMHMVFKVSQGLIGPDLVVQAIYVGKWSFWH